MKVDEALGRASVPGGPRGARGRGVACRCRDSCGRHAQGRHRGREHRSAGDPVGFDLRDATSALQLPGRHGCGRSAARPRGGGWASADLGRRTDVHVHRQARVPLQRRSPRHRGELCLRTRPRAQPGRARGLRGRHPQPRSAPSPSARGDTDRTARAAGCQLRRAPVGRFVPGACRSGCRSTRTASARLHSHLPGRIT